MTSSFIVAAHRSAVAPENGAFARLDLHEIAAPPLCACLKTADLDAQGTDEVILGNALYGGGNPARLAALAAGLPESVAGLTIDRQCASGLDAIILASNLVQSGAANAILAGGAESHSRRPERHRTDPDGGPATPYDRPAFSPFPDRDPDLHDSVETLAGLDKITQEAQNDFAIQSHQKALRHHSNYPNEIVTIVGQSHDVFTRNLTQRTCQRARHITNSLTAANTAIKADGAAFVFVVNAQIAARLAHLKPVQIIAGVTLGTAPEMPALAPVLASKTAMKQARISPTSLTAIEIMEAYAAQAIACQNRLSLDPAKVNIGGGALARGHPIGASGAINAVRLFHQLQTSPGTGLATIASAGGIGSALILKTTP